MSELLNKLVSIKLPFCLKGLENTETLQIRPLPLMTIFASANRFLKFGFPPQRNYELYLQIISKSIQSPNISSSLLRSLPLKTLETITNLVFKVSTSTIVEDILNDNTAIDIALTLTNTLEELHQYDLNALVSEDLMIMESNQTAGLHGYFFKPTQNREHLEYLLKNQDYRSDLMSIKSINPYANYWLCRQLTSILPWNAILNSFNSDKQELFPYLYRFLKIRNYLIKHLDNNIDYSSLTNLVLLITKISNWLIEQFPQFSMEVNVASPVNELVLVEGTTEELLLPLNVEALGYNLAKEGILIQSVGGKNQMLSQYINYAEHMAVPISIVMDRDAKSLLPDLTYYKRPQDYVCILEEGEFEDTYALDLIVKTVNDYYHATYKLTLSELKKMDELEENRVKTLEKIWHNLGLGTFNKIEFAHNMAQTLKKTKHVTPPMRDLIKQIIESRQNDSSSFFI